MLLLLVMDGYNKYVCITKLDYACFFVFLFWLFLVIVVDVDDAVVLE